MKNDKIIASWNKILPDEAADERMLSKILEYQHSFEKKERVISMTNTMKKLIPMAACFVLMIAVSAFIGVQCNWFGEKNNNVTDGEKNIHSSIIKEAEGGENAAGTYSVACFPAERVIEDVASATCTAVSEEEIKDINGLCDYVPSEIPASYHLEAAGFYETIMKDGTKYRMLKITYRSCKDSVSVDKENNLATFDPSNETHDFCVSVCDFQPDVSDTFNAENLNEESIVKALTKDIFCIKYEDYYVAIEPISLSSDETVLLIKSINS